MIRRLLVAMFLCMGCIWGSAQEIKTENFSINIGENLIDSLATIVAKSDSLVLHADSLVLRLDSMTLKKDSLTLVSDSLFIPTDSLALMLDPSLLMHMDSLGIIADTLLMQPDTLLVQPDTLLVHPDTLMVPVDTLATKVKPVKKVKTITRNERIMKAYADSLKHLAKAYRNYMLQWEDMESSEVRKIRLSSEYYKLFVPPTFYMSPLEQAYGIEWEPGCKLGMTSCDSVYTSRPKKVAYFELPDMERRKKVDRWVNRILLKYYMEHPDRVVGNELNFADMKALDDIQKGSLMRSEKMKEYMVVGNPLESANREVNMLIMKPNFWKYAGSGKIQFTQHGVSDNWYTGGENTNALYSELTLAANYDNKQGIEFENKLEMKLGFITTPSDTLHNFKTNSDMLRFSSKFGVRAIKNVYYTVETEVKTQFLPNYRTNSNDMVSNFLSPLQLKVKLGLDYKYSNKIFSLSILGAPLTYKHVYLKNNRIVNPSSFEVESGRRTANLYGSELTGKLNCKLSKNITWNSKMEYFTTYEKVVISWENTFDFKVSRYLSTTLFIHPRFDDGVTLTDDNRSYFQFKEMLTFGLSYSW